MIYTLLFEALMKLVQLQWKSLFNKNLPSLMIYVHKSQCQLFHRGNGIIWLKNLITLVQLNHFRPINLFLHLICVSFKTRRGSPVDDRPSTDKLHHLVQKKKKCDTKTVTELMSNEAVCRTAQATPGLSNTLYIKIPFQVS